MDLKGFGKGTAIALGATAIFPPLAPFAVLGIVGGAGLTAASTPFRTPNVPQQVQQIQQPYIQRPALTR